ncbi:endonuclease/exonuclease/phosphatase family protein [Anaerorudis cellulosivorans]|uniref:endonuclease/exonuclease/phosphatase family protein n=1 Tax=Anaerorudis cellulosivorans TaxID=3397862 RepID=UPI002220039C|nr:endonuclease/exonuclease/phosphatase family protein [Seramator thermalis]MCW1735412.1 endonuclease/exonuclease/phosphatase family protein [Seramator thermalis]
MKNYYFGAYFLSAVILFVFLSCYSFRQESKTESGKIRILSYNIRNARGMDEVVNYDRIAGVIRRIDPDCVALQELDSATERSLGKVVLDELAKRLGMYASYGSSIDYQGGKYGIGILSKEKPLRKVTVPLPGSEEKRSLLIVELPDYVMCCTHWSLRQPDRLSSVEVIKETMEKYTTKPVFLAGDLNATPGSPEIQKLSRSWEMLNDPYQLTIPSDNPRNCIDYIFFKKNPLFHITVLQTCVENESMASDHRPVWVDVQLSKK